MFQNSVYLMHRTPVKRLVCLCKTHFSPGKSNTQISTIGMLAQLASRLCRGGSSSAVALPTDGRTSTTREKIFGPHNLYNSSLPTEKNQTDLVENGMSSHIKYVRLDVSVGRTYPVTRKRHRDSKIAERDRNKSCK